ncbi:MAG: urea transporter [Opitutae bacterium]|nr:urea transporter [Opitutae bacterium]
MMNDSFTIESSTGWGLILSLGALWVLLGWHWGKKATSEEGFTLAGRKVGLALGGATIMATWVTSNTTMLAPVFALKFGLWGMLAYSTASFGLFMFALFMPRIRELLPDGVTAGDFFYLRFGKAGWTLFMVITLVYSLSWLVSMAIAGGDLLEALAGIPYQQGMSLILMVCILYTLFGGMYAVIGTDFIQSLIILLGIVVIGFLVWGQVPLAKAHAHIVTHQPSLLLWVMPAALLAVFNNLLFGFGEVFHNNVWWSRAFAVRKEVGSRAFALAGFLWFPVPIAAGFIALRVLKHPTRPENFRKVGAGVIFLVGGVTWLMALPHWPIINVLFLSGPLVGSLIWPVIAGLFWEEINRSVALAGIVLGSLAGLFSYFWIGWFVAALVGTGVSMLFSLTARYIRPSSFPPLCSFKT